MMSAVRWLPLAMLVALGALWGGNPAFSKALGGLGIGPFGVVFWQTGLACVILLPICLWRRQRIGFDRRALAYYFFIGGIGIGLPYAALVLVVGHVTTGFVSVLVVLSPMLTYVFAILVRLERLNAMRAAGLVLGLVGVAILVLPSGSLPAPEALPYALIALYIPAGYAAANVYAEWGRPEGASNEALACGTMGAAALLMAVFGLADGSFHPAWDRFDASALILVAYAVSTVVAFLLFYAIVAAAGAVYLGQVGYLVTLSGIGWGMLLFDERHGAGLWLAALIVFVGVALVNFGKPRPVAETA
jgi:drug/metabolite transporter (DMT)-like permease